MKLGRPTAFVKRITGVTIAEMVRQEWLVEVKVPNPAGYSVDPATGEKRHDGSVLNTGQYRSVFPQPKKVTGKSNKQMKREDRKAFFQRRRAAV